MTPRTQMILFLLMFYCFSRTIIGVMKLKFALGIGRHSIKAESFSSIIDYSQYFSPKNIIQQDSMGDRGPSIVTSRGLIAATYTGQSFYDIYGSQLFPDICSGKKSVFIYADGEYNRTQETAAYIAKGLAYTCSSASNAIFPVQILNPTGSTTGPGSPYRIISEGQDDNRYPGCKLADRNETFPNYGSGYQEPDLDTSTWMGPQQYLQQNLFFEISALSDAVGFRHSSWCESNPDLCVTKTLLDVPTEFFGAYFAPWKQGWDISKSLVNMLYFQAADNRPILNNTMSVHTVQLLKKIQTQLLLSYINDFNVHSFGVDLIAQVLGLLEQAATGHSLGYSEIQPPVTSNFVLLVGHDANILQLLRWVGSDATPFHYPVNNPGFLNFVFFELWQQQQQHGDSSTDVSELFVRVVYYSPPLSALRNLIDPLSMAASSRWKRYRSIVPIRNCPANLTEEAAAKPGDGGRGLCPYSVFKSLLLNQVMADGQPMGCMSRQSYSLLTSLANPVCLYGDCSVNKVCQVGTTCAWSGLLYNTQQCLEPEAIRMKPNCVPTMGWGCQAGTSCCNPAATCSSSGICRLSSLHCSSSTSS